MPGARALGRMIIQDLVPLGLSNRAIMRAVRAKGYGYRTELLNADINLFSGRYKSEYFIRKLNVNEVVPFNLMNETDLKMPRKYLIHGEQRLYNPFTDSYEFKGGSFYTDSLAKTGDWEDEFMNKFQICEERPEQLEGFKVFGADHNEGWEY